MTTAPWVLSSSVNRSGFFPYLLSSLILSSLNLIAPLAFRMVTSSPAAGMSAGSSILLVSTFRFSAAVQPSGIASLPTPFTVTLFSVTPFTVKLRLPPLTAASPSAAASSIVLASLTSNFGEPSTLPFALVINVMALLPAIGSESAANVTPATLITESALNEYCVFL